MADNQSAIALSRNPEFHKRTKYSCVSARKVRSHCRCKMALYCPMYSAWVVDVATSPCLLDDQETGAPTSETQLYWSPVTNIMADNQSAIALSRNPEFHKRTKHFNVKFHYQRAVFKASIPRRLQNVAKAVGPSGLVRPSAACSSVGTY
jgi:hypothetical protein